MCNIFTFWITVELNVQGFKIILNENMIYQIKTIGRSCNSWSTSKKGILLEIED